MFDDADSFDEQPAFVRWAKLLAPVAVLLVVVGIITALVLTDVVQGDAARSGSENPATTVSTIEIAP